MSRRTKDVLPNINRTQAAERAEKFRFLSLVTLNFDLWSWPSNSSERGRKHVFRVNLAQIRSAVPVIHKQKPQTNGTKNRTFRSSLRAVKTFPECGAPKFVVALFYLFTSCFVYFYLSLYKLRFVNCSLNEEEEEEDDDDDDDGLNTAKFGRAGGVNSYSRVAGGWERYPVQQRIDYKLCVLFVLVYKYLHQGAPVYLSELRIPVASSIGRSHLRSAVKECLVISYCRTKNYGQPSFSYSGPTLWNSLPLTLRDESMSLSQFCSRLKTEMFCRAYNRS